MIYYSKDCSFAVIAINLVALSLLMIKMDSWEGSIHLPLFTILHLYILTLRG